jgi:signal transduction histidine kinase
VVRAIVEAHGGTVDAATREGGGAVFTIELPAGSPPVLAVPPKPDVAREAHA